MLFDNVCQLLVKNSIFEFRVRAKFHWNRNIQTSMIDLTAVDVSLGEIREHQGQRICMYFRVKHTKGAKAYIFHELVLNRAWLKGLGSSLSNFHRRVWYMKQKVGRTMKYLRTWWTCSGICNRSFAAGGSVTGKGKAKIRRVIIAWTQTFALFEDVYLASLHLVTFD